VDPFLEEIEGLKEILGKEKPFLGSTLHTHIQILIPGTNIPYCCREIVLVYIYIIYI
jgi:hypothetical protein